MWFLPTKYVLSAEEVGPLKYTVQSPLEFGWDVKEQRPGREKTYLRCVYLRSNTFLVFYSIVTFCKYDKPKPFRQIGSKNSLNPGGIPLTVSQEYPPSGSRKGRCRSRLSSSWMSRPSLRIRLSAEAFAAATIALIKSCSEDDTWLRQRKYFRKRSY